MSKENNIKKGLLSKKMSNFSVEPPVGTWENISSQLPGGNSRRYLFVALAAAAGLALAITVGVNMINRAPDMPIAENNFSEEGSRIDILQSESENDISIQRTNEILEESPIHSDEERIQKSENSSEIRTYSKKPSKLEKKVLVAMEEVIDELEAEEGIILADNIEMDEDAALISVRETEEEAKADQTVCDPGLEDSEQQTGTESVQDITLQASIDSIASQKYLDSLSSLAVLEEEIIPEVSGDRSKWQVGASLSPIYSYRDASSADILQNQAVNSSETGRLSYSGGVQISYLSSERLSIESGLYYNNMGLAIGNFTRFESGLDYWVGNSSFFDNSIISLSNSIGTINTHNEDVFVNAYGGEKTDDNPRIESSDMLVQDEVVNSFEQSLEYLEIPFNLKYKVINRDFKLLLVGGVSTNLLVGNSVSANTLDGKIDYGSVQDIRTVNYSGNAGLGFVYSFSGNLSLSVEPRFRYYLNSINTEALPVTRPYVLGIYTGVNYNF